MLRIRIGTVRNVRYCINYEVTIRTESGKREIEF